jgi:hypothetical protein
MDKSVNSNAFVLANEYITVLKTLEAIETLLGILNANDRELKQALYIKRDETRQLQKDLVNALTVN